MSLLLHGDCLEHLHSVDDKSVDLIFCDLPYGQTSCEWDKKIDLVKLWEHFLRIKKLNTPIFFTTTTKFGVELINSAPKKCPFRYDLVWVKSAPAGFLSAKKMPMRKHEMIYVFYEKLPLYDLSSHKHKFIEKETTSDKIQSKNYESDNRKNPLKQMGSQTGNKGYDPPLPTSVVKEERKINPKNSNKGGLYSNIERLEDVKYDPPLPTSMLEIKSTRGKHSTEKPVALMEWLLKYYSKEGDVVLDPTMGSGSTGVACKNMNRNFIGIEQDPEIYQIAVNRVED
jgi:site-specific DNA-methyltransferase (adenine-specific)